MIRAIDYKLEHLFDMHINFDKYPICKNRIVLLSTVLSNGITKTIISNGGEVLAIISVLIMHTGTATVSIIPSEKAHKDKKVSFIRGILSLRDELENIVRENNLRRIETASVDDEEHNRWMEYLGFSAEGIKQMYGINGEDFIMWAKLWV